MDTTTTPLASLPAGLSTLAVHGQRGDPHAAAAAERDAPVVSPIMPSVSFRQAFGTGEGLRYAGNGNGPNVQPVQERLALLERAEAAQLLSSGMGATACAMLALLRPGDHLLSSAWIYGGTRRLFAEELQTLGIAVTFVDPTATREWKRSLRKSTRAVFVETPVNPNTRVLDLSWLARLTHTAGIALVVDSTLASPINYRPLEHGADVVIHSTTKYLNGHHDVLGGAVMGSASFVEEVRQKMILWGQAPDPFGTWLLERGLKTLDVRVRRQNENAQRLAEWCETRSEIARVLYPGLPSHPDHEIARAQLDGFGGMLALQLPDGAAADRFVRALRVIAHASSLGSVDSLVSEPRHTSHAHLSADARAALGFPDGFVRISVGIENADDLIADVERALTSA